MSANVIRHEKKEGLDPSINTKGPGRGGDCGPCNDGGAPHRVSPKRRPRELVLPLVPD
jgi:hypothetical protein